MKQTQIQERIEYLVTNGSFFRDSDYWKQHYKVERMLAEQHYSDPEIDLQIALCSMEQETTKSKEKRDSLFRSQIEMMEKLYMKALQNFRCALTFSSN